MVIDFHTHCFTDSLAPRAIEKLYYACKKRYVPCTDGTLNGLLKNMDKFGIGISVVQPVITKPSQTKTINEWAASICSDRIVSFGAVHHETDDYKRDIDFVCSLGLKGLKFHAEYQGFTVDSPKMLKIYDYAFSKGLIVLHHAGYDAAFDPPYHSSPKQFANISKELKGGVLVAAHLGGQKMWDDVERYLCGTDVYLDTSMGFEYYSNEQFLRILKSHGADKILFGSDSPWSRADRELEIFNSLPIDEADEELILNSNAKRLLNI